MNTPITEIPESRATRFKTLTKEAHDALDQRIMAFGPFSSRDRYAAFLQVQYRFHRDVDALFRHPELNRLLPGLGERARLAQVAQDLRDLGQPVPEIAAPPAFGADADIAAALGWLYAEEGSNLGAAFLYKFAAQLGLDENFGARHLAPHPGGRAPSWRAFTAQLDAVPLDAAGEARADAGAEAAFRQVFAYVEDFCPLTT